MDFYEEQRVDVLWLKIFMGIISMGVLVGIFIGAYTGGEEVDLAYYVGMVVTILILVFTFWLVFFTTLITSVSAEGFSYSYFPLVMKQKTIAKGSISSWKMETLRSMLTYGGFGIRKTYFPRKTAFMMGGKDIVTFELTNGRTVIFTTKQPEQLRIALMKQFSQLEKR